jgi:hypothetical protein
MKKYSIALGASISAVLLVLISCTSAEKKKYAFKQLSGAVMWLRDSTGGSHPDTLLVMYPEPSFRKDCTTVMLIGPSQSGSHPDTIFVGQVSLRRRKN